MKTALIFVFFVCYVSVSESLGSGINKKRGRSNSATAISNMMTTLEAAGFNFEESSVENGKRDVSDPNSWRHVTEEKPIAKVGEPQIQTLPELKPLDKVGVPQIQICPGEKPIVKVGEPQIQPPKKLVRSKTPKKINKRPKRLGRKARNKKRESRKVGKNAKRRSSRFLKRRSF